MTKVIAYIGFIFILSGLLPVYIAQAEELVFAYDNYPPLAYVENGQAQGASIDLVREACELLGHEPVFVMQPFVRGLDSVQFGSVDALIDVYYTPERAKYVYYPKMGKYADSVVVFVNKSVKQKPKSLADLAGHDVGAVRGYYLGKGVKEALGSSLHYVKDSKILYAMLNEGRLDCVIGNYLGGELYLKKLGVFSRFESAFVVEDLEYHLAFSRILGPKGQVLADEFAVAIEQILARRHAKE